MDLEEVKKVWKTVKEETIEEIEDLFTSFKEGLSDKSYSRKAWTVLQIVTIIVFIIIDVWGVYYLLSKLM